MNRTGRVDPLVQQYATDLGAKLRALRKKQGLSQERLGLMVGTKHPRISRIENGRAVPSISDLVKLCRALDVDPHELIDFTPYRLQDYPEQPPKGHAWL